MVSNSCKDTNGSSRFVHPLLLEDSKILSLTCSRISEKCTYTFYSTIQSKVIFTYDAPQAVNTIIIIIIITIPNVTFVRHQK